MWLELVDDDDDDGKGGESGWLGGVRRGYRWVTDSVEASKR
jgi:hypothetical protein